MQEDSVKTTLRLSAAFYKRVHLALLDRGVRSFQSAAEEGLRLWLNADDAKPHLVQAPPAAAGATKEEQSQVARFLDFLRTGDPGQVELVTHALDLHAKKQRRLRKPS